MGWREDCGTANFALIKNLTCGSATNNGTLTAGTAASGVSSDVPYTGGNGGTYSGEAVSSTGVTGLTATLSAGTLANGSGSVTYNITGTPSGAGTATFSLSLGGQTCNLTWTVSLPAATITSLTCGSTTNNGTLTAGTTASGVSSDVPYTGGNGGTYSGEAVSSTGVTGLTATLSAGTLANGSGSVTYNITGTPSGAGTATFSLSLGGQTCNLTWTVSLPAATITSLTCGSTTNNGTLTAGTAASGVSSDVPYTGGNGGTYSGEAVSSTGVTGLTATLSAGTLANGSGSVTYNITGTPSGAGTASFALSLGGQSCILTTVVNNSITWPTGHVSCNGIITNVIDVINPTTGKTWMDRNLGAIQIATSSTDADSYGDLYQWGRLSDGHQCRTSSITGAQSTSDQPGHNLFIRRTTVTFDWRKVQNDNLWQGVLGINNPCPSGYRVPTQSELETERLSWSSNSSIGAMNSPLKMPLAGARDTYSGSLFDVNIYGHYWCSTPSSVYPPRLGFSSSGASWGPSARGHGASIRCIKD